MKILILGDVPCGQVFFSRYPYFDKVTGESLGENYYEHQRESRIRIKGAAV
jgi:hypothetical protein